MPNHTIAVVAEVVIPIGIAPDITMRQMPLPRSCLNFVRWPPSFTLSAFSVDKISGCLTEYFFTRSSSMECPQLVQFTALSETFVPQSGHAVKAITKSPNIHRRDKSPKRSGPIKIAIIQSMIPTFKTAPPHDGLVIAMTLEHYVYGTIRTNSVVQYSRLSIGTELSQSCNRLLYRDD